MSATVTHNERAKLAYDLHQSGQSFVQISARLRVNRSRARALVTAWKTHLGQQTDYQRRFGAAADRWPARLLNALRRNRIENLDHLQQIIITHGLICTPARHWLVNGGRHAFDHIGDKSWTDHILPYLRELGLDVDQYITYLAPTDPPRRRTQIKTPGAFALAPAAAPSPTADY